MKRVQLLVLALVAVLTAGAATKNSTPDFAFPQTVDKDARRDLNTAIKAKDAHAALNALIRVYVANEVIGEQGAAQQSIELAESTAQKFAGNPLEGMFDALMARMYNDEYAKQRWVYDEREMPLEPRPSDITEWSGKQYKHVIDSLLDRSVVTPSGLSALRIGDYADIVEANKLTQTYYPTLFDFACSNAIVISNGIDQSPLKYCQAGVTSALKRQSVPAEVLWRCKWIEYNGRSNKEICEAYKALFLSMKDSEYASLPLAEYIKKAESSNNGGEENLDEIKWLVEQIDYVLGRWPSAPFAETLKSGRLSLMQKRVYLSREYVCSSGHPLQIAIENINTQDYTIDVYRLSNGDKISNNYSGKMLEKMRPVQSIKMHCGDSSPFLSLDTISITLEKQGFYAIMVTSSEFNDNNTEKSVMPLRCIDVMPQSLCVDSAGWMAIVNPQTGAPISGADVSYIINRNNSQQTIKFDATNNLGITDISSLKDKLSGGWQTELSVTYNGTTNRFDRDFIYFPKNYNPASPQVAILTDRAIYHPGDSVHYLIVFGEDNKTVKDKKLSMLLLDANRQKVEKVEVTTDEWGRAYGAFAIPTGGLTGNYSILCARSSTSFMVSDYRIPDFELVDVKVARDVPAKGEVTVSGRAVYYSGFPVAGATVTADLHECFWSWRPMLAKVISSPQATTDDNGEFSVVFTSSDFIDSEFYSVGVSAVSPSGTTATASQKPFSLGKQYVISLKTPYAVDGEKPFNPVCDLASYSGDEADFPIKWTISTLDSTVVLGGNSLKDIDLAAITPGRYCLTVEPVDTTLANAQSNTFTLYNVKSGIVPETGNLIWLPSRSITLPAGSQGELLFGVTDSMFIYSFIINENGVALDGKWYAKGYHTIKIDAVAGKVLLATTKDFDNYNETISIAITPEKPLKLVGETFRDKLLPGTQETWRLRVVDGEGRGVPAALALDMYNRALDALVPHDFSIAFNRWQPQISMRFNSHLFSVYFRQVFAERIDDIKFDYLYYPQFALFDKISSAKNIRIRGGRMSKQRVYGYGTSNAVIDMASDECEEEEAEETYAAAGANSRVFASVDVSDGLLDAVITTTEVVTKNYAEDIQMRDGDVPMAIWAPQLTTDSEVNVCYTFTVPNANASWRLYATAWTQTLRSANLTRDFIANKPLMVQPNAPRFLRAGDKAEVAIALLNNTDSLASVQAVVELFDPATGSVFDTQTYACDIDSMAQSTIIVNIEATSMQAAIGMRVKAFTSSFGDGEQLAIPVLPADASLIETTPFYLNPGDSTFTMTLPAQPEARISLTYCENPAWSIVSALPGLREDKAKYANSAAAVIFSAAIAQGIIHDKPEIASAIAAWQANPTDSALVSMLEKNEDLKIAILNATPWVQAAQSDSERMARLSLLFDKKQTSQAIGDAIDVLQKLQLTDGGWAWGDWCKQSSPWVTGRVLSLMADLKAYGWLPADKRLDGMIKSALKYWDKEVEGPNVTYSIVRKRFADVPVSTRGQQAITKTVNDILKHWKSYSDPAGKAVAAQALYLNGYPTKSRELMSSITEFGVWSESQGLRFPSVNALSSYAAILKAYAMIEPGSRQVDGLRQQLIVRKQATDWGSSVVTSDVVAAILSSGSRWTVAAQGADITAGGQAIDISGTIETATGSLRADLSAHAGQTLTVTAPSTGPSYGAVYSQFSQAMADVKASACDDLSIEKTMMVRRGTEWAYVDGPLQVGDRVKVQLTIHARRNLDYVEIIDERPAAFEPADQLPGWLWSQGTGFYRENRDAYTALHIISLAPCTYQLTYEMNVNTAGTYSSGVATIQSQYAPELSAHSAGTAIEVLQQ